MTAVTHVARRLSVPLLDLQVQYRELQEELMRALMDVCSKQHFILGPRVKELEERVAEYSQCRYGIGVSSGTDALLVALMALDIGPGDEVITTPFSFFATAGTIARLGARPLFCDIDPVTYNISPGAVEHLIRTQCDVAADGRLVNRRTGGTIKVLLPVHLFGQMADLDALMPLARRHGLRVIEDAAQAIGADACGRRAGSVGDIGCLSFFPTKNLGAFGDAGMCVTNDPLLAERLRVLRVHGSKPKYHHALVGGNFRLDEIQAAVLLVKFKYLDAWTAGRRRNAEQYTAAFARPELAAHVSYPRWRDGARHIFNQYVIRITRREELRRALTLAGIGTEVYYPVPLHMQRCFEYLGYRPDDCPESRRAADEVLAIPIYPELTTEQKEHVVDNVAAFFRDVV
jgi:dTDP-4-amino-4,6-dideoxygalactose transaminase